MSENLTPSQLSLGCQATDGANCEDGVAPEGALHLSEGEQGESPDGDRAVVNEAAGASSPFGLPSLSQAEQDQSAWLIEMDDTGRPTYWCRLDDEDGVCGWSNDHDKAIRFCRKRDAESIIEDMGWTEPRATEHGWIAQRKLLRTRSPGIIGVPRADGSRPRERDRNPKGGDLLGSVEDESPVPEGNSPDVPAANKSASLTPQNYEAKAREIADKVFDLLDDTIPDHKGVLSAISSAISSAVQAERERIRGMLVSKADALAIEAQIPGDPSRTAILMAKGQAYAEASSLLSAVSDADVEEGIRIAREIRPAIEAEIASAIRQEDANG